MSTSEHVARLCTGMIQGMTPATLNQASRLFWTTARGEEWQPEQYQRIVDAVGELNARMISRLGSTKEAREIVMATRLTALMQSEAEELQTHIPAPRAILAAATLVRIQAMVNTILDLAPDLEDSLDSWYVGTARQAVIGK